MRLAGGKGSEVSVPAPSMKCHCSKTQCLKMYCECFQNGRRCGPTCHCKDCHNTVFHQSEVEKATQAILRRNPAAFEQKLSGGAEGNSTALHHRKGCTCKKSGCNKAYCECFQLGVPCNELCKCRGCKNTETKTQNPTVAPKRQRIR